MVDKPKINFTPSWKYLELSLATILLLVSNILFLYLVSSTLGFSRKNPYPHVKDVRFLSHHRPPWISANSFWAPPWISTIIFIYSPYPLDIRRYFIYRPPNKGEGGARTHYLYLNLKNTFDKRLSLEMSIDIFNQSLKWF